MGKGREKFNSFSLWTTKENYHIGEDVKGRWHDEALDKCLVILSELDWQKNTKSWKTNVQFFTFDLNIVEELALDFIALYAKGYVPGICRR